MGLDNGILIKRDAFTEKLRFCKKLEDEYSKMHKQDFEVCYWRKCWNIRGLIFNILIKERGPLPTNDAVVLLNANNIAEIIEALKSLNAENWDEMGGSIWEFDEMKKKIKYQIKLLKKVKRAMKKYGDNLKIYFYDSY